MLDDHVIDHSRWVSLAVTCLVIVPAGAGFLTEAAEFTQQIRSLRIGDFRLVDIAPLADIPADVITRQVAHAERSHRKAEFLDCLVDLLRQAALLQQETSLTTVLLDHAVTDEAVTDTGDNTGFLDLLRQRQRGCQYILGSRLAAHDFQQLHDVCRAEEVGTDHVLWPLGEVGDLVDVQGRGVRRQNCARLHNFVQFPEHGFLDAHVFKNSFNHDVGLTDFLVRQRALDECQTLIEFLLCQFAFLHRVFIIATNRGQTLVERFLLGFQQRHGQAGIDEVHGDTATHCAGADDCNRLDFPDRGVGRYVR